MNMLNGEAYLCEPLQNLLIAKDKTFALHFLYFLGEVASICIAHNYVQMPFWGCKLVVELDDVLVIERLKNVCLPDYFLNLAFIHSHDLYLF